MRQADKQTFNSCNFIRRRSSASLLQHRPQSDPIYWQESADQKSNFLCFPQSQARRRDCIRICDDRKAIEHRKQTRKSDSAELAAGWNRFSGSQGNCSALKLHRAMLPGCDIVALAVPTPARSPLESLLVSREFIALMVSEGEVVLLPGERRRPRLSRDKKSA
jgi:hypothetical protein